MANAPSAGGRRDLRRTRKPAGGTGVIWHHLVSFLPSPATGQKRQRVEFASDGLGGREGQMSPILAAAWGGLRDGGRHATYSSIAPVTERSGNSTWGHRICWEITWKKETATVIYRSKRSWNTKRNF